MTTFDDREQAFEKKFAHDEDMQFKAAAIRNKRLGHWIGAKLGLSGDALDDYAQSVIVADLKEAGDEDVYVKITADLSAKNIAFDEAEVRAKMAALLVEAKAEIAGA